METDKQIIEEFVSRAAEVVRAIGEPTRELCESFYAETTVEERGSNWKEYRQLVLNGEASLSYAVWFVIYDIYRGCEVEVAISNFLGAVTDGIYERANRRRVTSIRSY